MKRMELTKITFFDMIREAQMCSNPLLGWISQIIIEQVNTDLTKARVTRNFYVRASSSVIKMLILRIQRYVPQLLLKIPLDE